MNRIFRYVILLLGLTALQASYIRPTPEKNYIIPLFSFATATGFLLVKAIRSTYNNIDIIDDRSDGYIISSVAALIANPLLAEGVSCYYFKRSFPGCSKLEIAGILVGTIMGISTGLATKFQRKSRKT